MKQSTLELIENMDAKIGDLRLQLAEMTEARDAVAAGAKWLRDKCTAQECVLNMIAAYGADNPNWAARIAWAMVDDTDKRGNGVKWWTEK